MTRIPLVNGNYKKMPTMVLRKQERLGMTRFAPMKGDHQVMLTTTFRNDVNQFFENF